MGGRYHMKIKAIILALTITLTAFAIISYAAEPGSAADPLALKSYVDSKIADLETKLTAMIQGGANNGTNSQAQTQPQTQPQTQAESSGAAESNTSTSITALAAQLDTLAKTVDELKNENTSLRQSIRRLAADSGTGSVENGADSYQNYAEGFIAFEAFENQRIMLGAGAELVLRTGGANAIHGELGALVDLISGKDLEAGGAVPINHLILSPRADNRGVRISEDAWVLVKGSYEIR